jgi:hypothetical protein
LFSESLALDDSYLPLWAQADSLTKMAPVRGHGEKNFIAKRGLFVDVLWS